MRVLYIEKKVVWCMLVCLIEAARHTLNSDK